MKSSVFFMAVTNSENTNSRDFQFLGANSQKKVAFLCVIVKVICATLHLKSGIVSVTGVSLQLFCGILCGF